MSTEKRLFLFLLLTFVILTGYSALVELYGPKKPPANAAKDKAGEVKKATSATAEDKKPLKAERDAPAVPLSAVADKQQPKQPHRVISLGSYHPAAGGSPLLVTLNSRGAALERIELVARDGKGRLQFRDLDRHGGYLGQLALVSEPSGGCRVQVVPSGTPAARCGLRVGDVLRSVNGQAIDIPHRLELVLWKLKTNEVAKLVVERTTNGRAESVPLSATLDVRPFELIRPEPLEKGETKAHPPSLLLSVRDGKEKSKYLEGLNDVDWEVREVTQPTPGVEFHYSVDAARATALGFGGPFDVIKRYRLGAAKPAADPVAALPYHVDFEIEFRNLGIAPQKLAYRLDGVNGLPTEGWWYLTKLHNVWFAGAGARDVLIHDVGHGHRIIGCPAIFSKMKKDEAQPYTELIAQNTVLANRTLSYIGVDTQYFAVAMIPPLVDNKRPTFATADALVLGDVPRKPKGWDRTGNTTFRLGSEAFDLPTDGSYKQSFTIFAGPKQPDLLKRYGLNDWIYYGWPIFGFFAKFLGGILHFFHAGIGNYGIAIILLTVLVRGCMFPVSRIAARNAAMMQVLAPEMRKIAEKHKDDLQARGVAQQELFRKYSYNPLSGCWLMFLQLPVFIGLYRCLATDIELRQAALVPSWEWCSNLAGPDKMFYWRTDWSSYFTDESGWLGPFCNLLPFFTIALFLVHQKLFTPPATDEQTAMQMKMMKYMTVFMGVLFYKVPAGLCIYFITSSLWGIAERKLIPPPKPPKLEDRINPKPSRWSRLIAQLTTPPAEESNGSARKKELQRKTRRKP